VCATRVEKLQGRGGGRVPLSSGDWVSVSRRQLRRICEGVPDPGRLASRIERGEASVEEITAARYVIQAGAERVVQTRAARAALADV
jgi:hypothetical protein